MERAGVVDRYCGDRIRAGMAVDLLGGKIYFAQHDDPPSESGIIYRANLDGSGLEPIVTGLKQPRDVALDLFAGRVYWVDEASAMYPKRQPGWNRRAGHRREPGGAQQLDVAGRTRRPVPTGRESRGAHAGLLETGL